MKRYIWINHVAASVVGPKIFQQLAEIYPQGVNAQKLYFEALLQETDPKLKEIEQVLQSIGMRRRKSEEEYSSGVYGASLRHQYEPADLARADYFRPVSWESELAASGRGPNRKDLIMLTGPSLDGSIDFGWAAEVFTPVVSSHLRRTIEAEAPIGAGFRDTTCLGSTGTWADVKHGLATWAGAQVEPYWELVPMLTLPRLSPRCGVVDTKSGEPWQGLRAEAVHIPEGDVSGGELHYRREDIALVEPFDLAQPVEPFWERGLVVSPRLKALLDRFNPTIVWHPVYVDDE